MTEKFKLPEVLINFTPPIPQTLYLETYKNTEKEEEAPKEKFKLPEELKDYSYPLKLHPLRERTYTHRARQVSLEGKVDSRVNSLHYRGNGHWQFPEPMDSEEYIGFIYVIRDIEAKRLYLGKKQYRSMGKETKGKESNWRWYISSSNELVQRVKTNGKHKFEFIAIEQYKTKATLSYAETWTLITQEAPMAGSVWVNHLVNKVSWVVKEPITQRHKDRIRMMLLATQI
jgi:hypothetical protein